MFIFLVVLKHVFLTNILFVRYIFFIKIGYKLNKTIISHTIVSAVLLARSERKIDQNFVARPIKKCCSKSLKREDSCVVSNAVNTRIQKF